MRRLAAFLHRDLPPVPLAGRLDAGAVAIPLVAAAAFVVERYHGRPASFRQAFGAAGGALAPIADHLWWFGSAAVLFGLVPLAALAVLREPLGEYGLGLGRRRLGLAAAGALAALMIPVALVASGLPGFAAKYPLSPGAALSPGLFLAYEAAYAVYFVAWEFTFRGFLLFGLYRRVGLPAVYALAVPFALVHLGKPEAEAFGSILAAVALGTLALRTRSFWWGAFLHVAVAWTMDLAAAWERLAR
ncbi:MAG TPA: CPBP family intramembrane glutamic endopeptidase [Anaeromyxobacteraceae bacterium]|nr:CPBP family intramembrane glutamic endopeptidase [Anaeromyxobacteraceae bacterium]